MKLENHPIREWHHTLRQLQPYRTGRALLLSLASAVILSGVMVLGAVSPVTHQLEDNFHVAYTAVANLVLFSLLYLFNFGMIRHGLKAFPLAAGSLLGSMALATLFTMLSYTLEPLLCGAPSNKFVMMLIINQSATLIAYFISLLLHNVTRQQQMVVENEHLQAENLRIRYEALEQQVSPHFLFNSLNTLDGLIGIDDPKAHLYLTSLASTLRFRLHQQREVTLGDELEFTHAYLHMMQIRYGDSLDVRERIDPALLAWRVVPISLQLLVENAIKHNVVSARHPLAITIEADPSKRTLTVQNPIQPKADQETPSGTGLANLDKRYELLYQRHISITSGDSTFSVELPLVEP